MKPTTAATNAAVSRLARSVRPPIRSCVSISCHVSFGRGALREARANACRSSPSIFIAVPPAQVVQRPARLTLHGSDRATKDPCGVVFAQVLVVAQDDHLSLSPWEREN